MLDVIAIYVITPEDRKLLYGSKLLGTMVQLLASNDKAVRVSACMAIQAVCRDEATAKALVDGGIIDVIQRVQQSSHLRSHLADATLNQVLDFDLSAKYSIKRKLQQINHIKSKYHLFIQKSGENFRFFSIMFHQYYDFCKMTFQKFQQKVGLPNLFRFLFPLASD